MYILCLLAKVGHAYCHYFASFRYKLTLLKINCLIKYMYAVLKSEDRFLLQYTANLQLCTNVHSLCSKPSVSTIFVA